MKKTVTIFLTSLCAVLALGMVVLYAMSRSAGGERGSKTSDSEQSDVLSSYHPQGDSAQNSSKKGDNTGENDRGTSLIQGSIDDGINHMRGQERDEKERLAMEEALRPRYHELLSDPELMEARNIHPVDVGDATEFVMDFTGDILFDPAYAIMANLKERGGTADKAFSRSVLDELRGADISFVNNEFPYSDRGAPLADKMYTFRARPESVGLLNEMGIDAVSLANNHAFDYGESALLDTIDIVQNAGITAIGAGRNIDEAAREVSYIAGDIKVAVIAATQIERLDRPDTRGATGDQSGVFRCWNPDKLIERIRELDKENDVVIVFVHWGTEKTTVLDWAQQDQAAMMADAGADVIVGAHPHVLQGLEYVKGVPVAYSLGNFLFNSRTIDTCILQIRMPVENDGDYDTSKIKVRVLPALQKDCRVNLMEGGEKSRVLSYLNSLSKTATLDPEGYLTPK